MVVIGVVDGFAELRISVFEVVDFFEIETANVGDLGRAVFNVVGEFLHFIVNIGV